MVTHTGSPSQSIPKCIPHPGLTRIPITLLLWLKCKCPLCLNTWPPVVLSGEVAGILRGEVQLEGVGHGRLGLRREGFVSYNPATVLALSLCSLACWDE